MRNADFKGGNLSGDGGAVLMLDFLRKKHLSFEFSDIPFHDDRCRRDYSNHLIMSQMVANKMLGYSNQSDLELMKYDPLLSEYLVPFFSVHCIQILRTCNQ